MNEHYGNDCNGAFTHVASSSMQAILDYPVAAVWQVIRDFNSYPHYIDGVTESLIEDDRRGDEVGCVRRFVYRGDVTRQTLTGHSDRERWFSHSGCEPLAWPSHQPGAVGPVVYENRIQVVASDDGAASVLTWSLDYLALSAGDAHAWKTYFDACIPVWIASLRSHLPRLTGR